MAATLTSHGRSATVRDGVWTGDPELAIFAEGISADIADRVHAYVPDWDEVRAREAQRVLGGTVEVERQTGQRPVPSGVVL